jgi:hypothetical protein
MRLPGLRMKCGRLRIAAAVAVVCGCSPSSTLTPSPPPPQVVWHLRDGTSIRHYRLAHNPPAEREDIKVIEVTRPGSLPKRYDFGANHAGYFFGVELRTNEEQTVIWIVDSRVREVGCSLDLTSGNFTGEDLIHPPCVNANMGKVVEPE